MSTRIGRFKLQYNIHDTIDTYIILARRKLSMTYPNIARKSRSSSLCQRFVRYMKRHLVAVLIIFATGSIQRMILVGVTDLRYYSQRRDAYYCADVDCNTNDPSSEIFT